MGAKWFFEYYRGMLWHEPDYIRAIKAAVEKYPPRKLPDIPIACRISGLELCTIEEGSC